MSDKHYRDILQRTSESTGLDKEFLDIICKCFLYEVADELVQRTIELPYLGDISLRNKKFEPNKFIKTLKNQDGVYANKFKRRHAETFKGRNKQCDGSIGSSERSGVDGGIPTSNEDNNSDKL